MRCEQELGVVKNKWLTLMAWVFVLLLPGCSQTTDVEHIAKAKAFESSGDFRSAIIEYKSALSLNSNSVESRFSLGSIYAQLGDTENARKELAKASEANYRKDEASVLVAELDLLEGRYQRVIDDYLVDELKDPRVKSKLLAYRGLAYLGLGEPEAAEAEFGRSFVLSPQSEFALYGEAKRLLLLGRLDRAKALLEKAVEINPKYHRAMLLLGDVEFASSNFSGAEKAYKYVIASEPEKTLTRLELEANFGLLQTYVSQSNLDAASEVVDYLIQVVPGHALPKYFKGLIAYQRQQYGTAEEYLLRVINIMPTHKPSFLLLGAVNFAQGELEQADEYLSRYLAAEPSNVHARKLLAATRMRLSQPDLAVDVLGPLLERSDQDVQALLMAGSAAVRSGDYQVGTAYLKEALDVAPQNSEVRTELALAYLAESHIDQALKELEIASSQQSSSGSNKRADILLVFTHLRNNDTASALEVAETYKQKFSDDPVAYNLLGVVYDYSGEESKARRSFEDALELKGDYVPAIVNLARLDQRAGRLKEASKRYEAVLLSDQDNVPVMLQLAGIARKIGDVKQSIGWLNEAIKADSDAVRPKLMLAHYYLRSGDIDKAAELAHEANRITPDAPPVLAMLGMVYSAGGKKELALRAFDKLLKLDPGNYVAHYQSALVYANSSDIEQARLSLLAALKLKRDYLPAAALLARYELKEGNFSRVQAIVNEVKASQPNTVAAHIMEADLLVGEGQYAKAISLYEKAIKETEHVSLVLKISRAYSLLGRADEAINVMSSWVADHDDSYQVRMRLASEYQSLGKVKEAISHYEAIVKYYPGDALALNNLAWLYSSVGEYNAAMTMGEKAFNLQPENAYVLDTYGWILAEHSEFSEAEKLLKKALSIAPDVADIKYHYAVVLVKVGKSESARKLLQELLEKPEGLSEGVEGVKGLLEML